MAEIKDRIVAAARGLYSEGGPEAVTMRGVADRVGVTATALYRHFADKDALLRAAAGEGSRVLGSHLFRALEAPTALERLRAAAGAYLEFALAEPQAYRALLDTPQDDADSPAARQQAAVRRFLRDRAREAMDAGALHAGDPDGAALTLWALLHGLATLHHAGIAPADALQERALTSLLDGMAPGSERLSGR